MDHEKAFISGMDTKKGRSITLELLHGLFIICSSRASIIGSDAVIHRQSGGL
jgi:hypothetical protein